MRTPLLAAIITCTLFAGCSTEPEVSRSDSAAPPAEVASLAQTVQSSQLPPVSCYTAADTFS